MVKLDVAASENYFPRGGSGAVADKPKSTAADKGFPAKAQKRKTTSAVENSAKKAKEEAKWVSKVEQNNYIEGLMGVGVVTEVYDDSILMHTNGPKRVRIGVSEVGKRFGEMINEEKISMKDSFEIGQMVPFKVLAKNEKGTTVSATCNPAKLNKHLSPNMIVAGLVIHACVTSIEEKGAILDIGLDKMSGFMDLANQPASGIKEGKPIMVRVLSTTSRVVKVTSFVEQDNLNITSCEKLQLNHLMPGTILECEPTGDVATNGVFVSIGNGLKGLIYRQNLPPRLRENPERIGKAIRAVVMLCQQNSHILVLNAHPDIVAASKIEKRTNFDGISIGDKLKCVVVDVIPSSFIVHFSLPSIDGKKSLVTAVSSKNFLENPDKIDSQYKIGEEKLCRVVGLNYLDRSLIVSTRKDILNQTVVSYNDAVCGEIVDGKVVSTSKFGINLIVCNFVRAFCPIYLLGENLPEKKLKMKYKKGATIKCRIWDKEADRKQIIVSCNEEVIKTKCVSTNENENLKVGSSLPCFVVKVFPTGSLLLKSFNQITGIMKKDEAALLGDVKLYSFVEANIEKIEENNRFVFVPKNGNGKRKNKEEKDKTTVQKPKSVDEAVEIGKVYKGVLTAQKDETANVVFAGNNGKDVFATVEDSMLSDLLDAPIGLAKRIMAENKEEIERIVPMGKISAINRACVKRFVAKWIKNNKTPKSLEDLEKAKVVGGIVCQISSDVGTFVEIVGGSGMVAKMFERKNGNTSSELFEIGQFVIGKVAHLNQSKGCFFFDPVVEMKKEMIDKYALPMLSSIVDEIQWLAENSNYPTPGSVVKAKVTKRLEDMILVEFEHNSKKVSGIVHRRKDGLLEKKKSGNLIVVDINHATNEVVLAEKSGSPVVASVKRDYICAIDSNGLVYLPTRLHPNHLPQLDSTIKINDSVNIDKIQSHGDIRLAIRKDDCSRAASVVEHFVGKEEKKEAQKDSEVAKEAESKKSIKNFGIYEATVLGDMKVVEGQKKNGLFARLELPGKNIGRLHVSELPAHLLSSSKKPMGKFLKRNLKAKVMVRIIGFSKEGKTKIADLTMVRSKIEASKVRAAVLGYNMSYKIGDVINCFGAASLSNTQESEIRVEVNGIFDAKIPREYLSDDLKVQSADGGIVDITIERGEIRKAKVVGVDKKNKTMTVSLILGESTGTDFEIGAKVTGRVFGVDANGLLVKMKLSSGQQALLTPTAITDKYESFDDIVAKRFAVGELVNVVCTRMCENPKRYYVSVPSRFEQIETCKSEKRKLVVDRSAITVGAEFDGIVSDAKKKSLFVEIGPGISGRIAVSEENEEILEIGAKSVVRVGVENVTDDSITLKLNEILIRKWAVQADRKRKATDDEGAAKVVIVEEKQKEKVAQSDPGFDWENKGFRNQDMAAVGKLTSKTGEEEEEEDSEDEDEEQEDEEEVEESDEEEELVPSKKARLEKPEEEEPEESEEELSKLIRSDPNSAILWIKYMSLFLGKSDLSAARATAERAIETINYRETAEIRNLWTAYLNMEVAYGDQASIQKVFEKACSNSDSYTMHHQLAQIYQNSGKEQEAKQILETMVKKFRAQHVEVWTLLAEHLMRNNEQKAARDLLQRALSSAPKQHHIQLISKFAQMEFKHGDSERGATLFEGLVNAHPKKTDIWIVYIEATLKHVGIEQTRKILERACSTVNSLHKMRPLYKKWLEIENRHGDASSIELVKSKAEKYLQSVADNVLSSS